MLGGLLGRVRLGQLHGIAVTLRKNVGRHARHLLDLEGRRRWCGEGRREEEEEEEEEEEQEDAWGSRVMKKVQGGGRV